ncbi:MAG: hypothetical protein M3237_08595 [Actinomycetota bacterium]|nr:hypothetical protein [Actinomycetota bacterium]
MAVSPRNASLLVVALAAVGTLSACSGTSEAQTSDKDEPTILTFTLDGEGGDYDQVGGGKNGTSLGGHHMAAMTLESDGKVAGRMLMDCTVADPTYDGQTCSGLALVDGGTLAFENVGLHEPIPGIDPGEEAYAVTGGTGEYAGASGEMVVGQEENDAPVTITLLP